jgi:signal peptidase II
MGRVATGAARRRVVRHGALAAAVAAADGALKVWATGALAHGPRVLWPGHVELVLWFNRGAMLGIGALHPGWVLAVGLAGVTGLALWVGSDALGAPGAAVMLGGGVGNVADRLLTGSVTDYVHVVGWSGIFNLADVALRVGAVAALAAIALARPPANPGARDGAAHVG